MTLLDSSIGPPSADVGDRLTFWAAVRPEAVAFTFLERGETPAASLSYAALHDRACAIGTVLRRAGLAGRPVLLLYPPGLAFIEAFCACLYSGAIAVPAPYPTTGRTTARSAELCRAAGVSAVLTLAHLVDDAGVRDTLDEAAGSPAWIATDAIADDAADGAGTPAGHRPEEPAFLQFTSGSTAAPRGVVVTRGNLAANQTMIAAAFGHDGTTRFVTWLPMFHDMGLIGTVLQPIYLGVPSAVMSPFAFLQKPMRWLQAIDRFRATTSGAPNFAYELCLRHVGAEQRAGLDLGNWKVAFCGAEPVRGATLRRFAAAFAPQGFSESRFLPCYGLAEATLFVSGGPAGTGLRGVDIDRRQGEGDGLPVNLTSCGRGWGGQRLVIADPVRRTALPAGQVGEIWLAGPHVCAGYWRRPEAGPETFGARLCDDDATPYLRTGDLGFLRHDDLYVTGRLKDLIIVRGVNHHPEEIEATIAASAPALASGGGAVFTVDDGDVARVVALQEVVRDRQGSDDREDLVRGAVAAVTLSHGFRPDVVALVRMGSLPRTTSGKIQRHLCRLAYVEGRLGGATPVAS